MADRPQKRSTKKVGQYLVDAGVLKQEQLDAALERQRRMGAAGFQVPIGVLLEQMGAIDRESLEAIIVRQRLDAGAIDLGGDVDWHRRDQTIRVRPVQEPAPAEEPAIQATSDSEPPESEAVQKGEDEEEDDTSPQPSPVRKDRKGRRWRR